MSEFEDIFEFHFWANVRSAHNAHVGMDYDTRPPKVGPFWFEPFGEISFVFADRTVLVQHSDTYENLKNPGSLPNRGLKKDHASLWAGVLKEFPDWAGKKFYEVPRGRIILKEYDKYFVFLSRVFVDNLHLREAILNKFNLPSDSTVFMISPEYKI